MWHATKNSKMLASLDEMCADGLNAMKIVAKDEGGCFDFTSKFAYLASVLNFIKNGTIDAKNRMLNSDKAMGTLKLTWKAKIVLFISKIKSCAAIPVSLLL